MFIYNLQYLLMNMYSKCLTLYIQRYIMMMKGVLFMTQINFRIEEDIKENAEKALKDIEKQGLRLVPLCPFVAGYIHKHPEWKRIVMKGIHIQ